jgi:hypothetical protein
MKTMKKLFLIVALGAFVFATASPLQASAYKVSLVVAINQDKPTTTDKKDTCNKKDCKKKCKSCKKEKAKKSSCCSETK